MSSYTALPSQSSTGLPLYESRTNASSRSPSSPHQHSTDTEKESENDRKGLLAAESTEEEDEGDVDEYLNKRGDERQPTTFVDKLPLRPRTLFLSIFSTSILLSLMLFFHPSRSLSSSLPSSISHDSTSYYSGSPLSIGLFDPTQGQLSPNPLPKDATFGDVPFARVGESWDEDGKKPEWAGGDGGNKEYEKGFKGEEGMMWNGTSWWKKTVILVTLEGMRPDYLSEELTPNLLEMARQGVRAEYLEPVFPSLSAPNQWSILTGLYPSSHGIVSNKFYSPSLDKSFDSTSPSAWDTSFPLGEPIYQTALRSHHLVATLHHPSIPPLLSTIPSRPTYWYPPVPHTRPPKTLSKLLSFLDLPLKKRPELLLVNLDDVARDARLGGGRVTDDGKLDGVEKGLGRVDTFLGGLRDGLRERGVEGVTEIVVVGDTGLIDTSLDRIVYLDELLGDAFDQIEHQDGSSTFVGLRFPSSFDTSSVLSALRTVSEETTSGFSVYTREEMPESWHFTENERIAPIWLIAKEGWGFSTKEEMEKNEGKLVEKAANGYDPSFSTSMRSIFISTGPFTSTLKGKGAIIKGFSNLQVYDFVASSLGISQEMRAMNNATIGFWEGLTK